LFKIANFLGKKTSFSLEHMIERQPARSPVVRKTERTILSSRDSKNRYELLDPKLKDATVELSWEKAVRVERITMKARNRALSAVENWS
jgi:hypothetical protein